MNEPDLYDWARLFQWTYRVVVVGAIVFVLGRLGLYVAAHTGAPWAPSATRYALLAFLGVGTALAIVFGVKYLRTVGLTAMTPRGWMAGVLLIIPGTNLVVLCTFALSLRRVMRLFRLHGGAWGLTPLQMHVLKAGDCVACGHKLRGPDGLHADRCPACGLDFPLSTKP